ncbi:MAG: glycosyltransferase family 2 protein [Desulfobacterales bacterium]|nr:glycosyltransferase family 2 protein [Desulfobacterales bacterium]
MTETSSLVSVVIPVYNGGRYLAEAIESVRAQTYQPLEIIVVDDGSEDDSGAIAQGFADVRCFQQPNEGPASARNRGVADAGGAFLAFLDADDLWTPDKLRRQMALMNERPELDVVFGGVEQFRDPGLDEKTRFMNVGVDMKGMHVGAMLIRRDAFDRVGLFRTRFSVGEFIDWWARAKERGLQSAVLPEKVLGRRLHENNLMRRERGAAGDYLRILRASLRRRREESAR